METTFARQAFPSIDEPEAKATFDLALKFDEQPGEIVLANMPELREEDGVHYFATTVRMSTYLVAFAFGDLQSKTTRTKSGVEVGVFATKAHKANELDFALDIAKRSIEFYEDFYQTPYPLPHSWQLALPDFSAGAMENWGLVTYREAYLTLDPDNTPLRQKQVVATVIAHELAHQWFGDLVTMKWWDDLWLNESFANMMEYVAIDAIEPDWHIWELFQTDDVSAALNRDATDGVQSVHVQVEDPAEIDALFDGAIVYAKGARMLVMVRALLGDDALRKGLKAYFDAHQYGNATGADLWQALGDASGLDVGAIMTSWLEQPGYPVVTAAVVDGQLTLSQQQFFIGEGEEKGRQWQIPVPLLQTFANSEHVVVTTALYDVANNLKKFVTPDSEEEHQLQMFFDSLSRQQVARLGWHAQAGESSDDAITRPLVLRAALYAQNAEAIAAAHDLFVAHQADLAALPAEVRGLVLRNEVENYGSEALFDQLLQAYVASSDATFKRDIQGALTQTPDSDLIATLISKFEDANTIKPQDLRAWYRGVLANKHGQQVAWDWIRADWQWLQDTVGGDMEFTTYITVTAAIFQTAERLAEFKAFFEPKLPTPGLTREITMDIKVVETRVALVEAEQEAVNAAVRAANND